MYVVFFPNNEIIDLNDSIGDGKIIELLSNINENANHNSSIKNIPKINSTFLFVKNVFIYFSHP